ncbi:copia protein [Tanacetum coccineum]|uniref:Copia protein n=1 Tax=Tanacetum coccineum TaxID=301880 RepID=A0ABQ5J6R3_9ASTR
MDSGRRGVGVKKKRITVMIHNQYVIGSPHSMVMNSNVGGGGMNEVGTTVLDSFPPLPMQVTTSAGNAPGKYSFANVTGKPSGKKLNIRTLFTSEGNGIDVVVLVAYHVVANYVRNTWGKYGYSFQFITMEGLEAMLENGLWFIRNNLLLLKKWHPNKNLLKEDVSTVSVWVKLYGVPVTAFSDDGLNAIATKLGTPVRPSLCKVMVFNILEPCISLVNVPRNSMS